MKKAFASVFFKIKGVEYSFNVDIPYKTAIIWDSNKENWRSLALYIESCVIEYKKRMELHEPTDPGSLNLSPHIIE